MADYNYYASFNDGVEIESTQTFYSYQQAYEWLLKQFGGVGNITSREQDGETLRVTGKWTNFEGEEFTLSGEIGTYPD